MKNKTYLPTSFETVKDVAYANRTINHKWFDPSTMRFFNSQVNYSDKLIKKRFFISSEQFIPSSGRAEAPRFTIRVALPTGEVETVGEFQAYKTRNEAIAAAHKII